MRWVRHAVPRQRLGEGVLERRRLEAKLPLGFVDHLAGRPARVWPVGTRVWRKLGEWDRVQARRNAERAGDPLDQVANAHTDERRVVRLVRRVLARVACERAREADVLDPREARLALV